ncbi:M16 family metallopeptidase [Aureliella helgolandensis]|uniref:Peptidase M16 inactive domain protein n=1 Tax=Aureliella helgolandensis TaxID=2527968 RepID=A0A518GCF1_9BACT|nr:pitrilysin family protein [Aureliella helgolandensis]QDV26274.1 Peptidase M16 inactive domain protein [Aureliella helgolandensis]
MSQAADAALEHSTTIEGITAYRLENGAQVLLFPDESKSMVTVNMTVFVGSRHEGYGEAGMAHLLEHMLFKGTPGNEKIPEELKNRGANFNGTTWLDRTNYYETLPATTPAQAEGNLEYAIRLEADRLMNSFVKGEDLISEMTVVRNEFESGENNPRRILMQRVQSAAFDWHNYGRSTIGNQSDIERVPIDRLQAFYRKFYRPDNIMVVVAGKFDMERAQELIEQNFGSLAAPDVPLDRTYTTEPPQDGERTVALRRVGNTQYIMSAYHVPPASHRDYAAIEILAYIFGTEPSGRLYQDLVLPELASNSSTFPLALHDPGLIMFNAQLPVDKSIEAARQALIQSVEEVAAKPITAEELSRAQTQFLKERELRAADSMSIAVELSEWAAQGDWRLYFLFRDYVESLTPEECTAVATQYLNRNNRTLGLFIPSEKTQKVEMPTKPNLNELLADYVGREDIQQGEAFDPDPLAIEARTERGTLSTGLKTALLPKRTRGSTVNLTINLRYGNEQSLLPLLAANEFLPEMMMRGTQDLSYEQLEDRLDALRAEMRMSGTTGLLSLSVETKRESMSDLLQLVADILRHPRFAREELEVIKRQQISRIEAQMTEPGTLAGIEVQRKLSPYDPSNIRYVPTLAERIERYQSVTVEQLQEIHATQLDGRYGEITAVGDFDPEELLAACETIFQGWTSDVSFARIATPANTDVPGSVSEIMTPDKANAIYYAGMQIPMRDDDPDYPALLVGNYVLGAGALSSRLGDRVRQKEGLSYGVGSGLNAHPVDKRTSLTLYAITNPENRDRVVEVISEELELLLADGITAAELDAAQQGLLQSEQLDRTQDRNLTSTLAGTIFANRTMQYYSDFEQHIADLDVETVNAALRKYIDPERLVIVTAGDFAKVAAE